MIYNEATLVTCAGLFVVFRGPQSQSNSELLGWVSIGIIGINIIINLLVTIITMTITLCVHLVYAFTKIKELCKKKFAQKKIKPVEDEEDDFEKRFGMEGNIITPNNDQS